LIPAENRSALTEIDGLGLAALAPKRDADRAGPFSRELEAARRLSLIHR